MAVFTLEEGRLVPAGHVDVLGSGLAAKSLEVIRARVIELLERPLFPVSWQGERDADTLVALDPTGRVVSIEVLAHVDSHELMTALARAGRYANLSRSQLAQIYSQGSEDFARDWQEFLDTCEPHPAPGPRLFLVVLSVDHAVRPAVQALAGAGLQVNLVQVHEAGDRVLVSIDEVRPLAPGISGVLGGAWHLALADAQEATEVPVALRADSAPTPEEAEVPEDEFAVELEVAREPVAEVAGEPEFTAEPEAEPAGDSVEYVGSFGAQVPVVDVATADVSVADLAPKAAAPQAVPTADALEPEVTQRAVPAPAAAEPAVEDLPVHTGYHKRGSEDGVRARHRHLGPRMARRHGAHRHLAEQAERVAEPAGRAVESAEVAGAAAVANPDPLNLPPRSAVAGQPAPGGAAPIRLSPRVAQRPSARSAESTSAAESARVEPATKASASAAPSMPQEPPTSAPAAPSIPQAPKPSVPATHTSGRGVDAAARPAEPAQPLVQPLAHREEAHPRPAAFGSVEGYVGPTAFAESVARQERARRRLEQRLWEEAAPSVGTASRGEANASYASSEAVAQAADRDYRSPAARLLAIARRNRAPFTVIWECEQRNVTYYGEVTAWGTLVISGFGTYTDPSSAARAVSALPGIDGWQVWKASDGRALAEL